MASIASDHQHGLDHRLGFQTLDSGLEPIPLTVAGQLPEWLAGTLIRTPGTEREDSGVLLSVVLDATAGTSFLLVLDATDLTEIARARVPRHIPFGFHGDYFPVPT